MQCSCVLVDLKSIWGQKQRGTSREGQDTNLHIKCLLNGQGEWVKISSCEFYEQNLLARDREMSDGVYISMWSHLNTFVVLFYGNKWNAWDDFSFEMK